MTEWQEIKSAPKNGKRLLLAYPNGTVKVGYWDEGGRYWAANQWLHEPPPTHWMPLPIHPLKSASASISQARGFGVFEIEPLTSDKG